MSFHMDNLGVDTHTHTEADAGNDKTWRPKLASGKNANLFLVPEINSVQQG